jgi:DSF synthase
MNAIVSSAFLPTRTSPHVIEHSDGSAEFAISPQFSCQYDVGNAVLWSKWTPRGVPCFNVDLLRDLERGSQSIEAFFSTSTEARPLRYVVLQSGVANVFNVGGDLAYFQRLIKAQDRAGLTEYARIAIDVVYRNYTAHNLRGVTTIALLEGDALGGGFESAMSCDMIVAEKHVKAGFPEVLFNMFPGMGGMSFLARRAGKRVADEMVRTGRLYSAIEMHELGLVDQVVDTGAGLATVQKLMRQREHQQTAHVAMNAVDRLIRPVGLQELHDIVKIWVDCALRLDPRSLEWMQRLHQRQLTIFGGGPRLAVVENEPSEKAVAAA